MDPNVTLAEILELAEDINNEIEGAYAASLLAERIAELDQWITSAGFLPARWSKENAE